MVISKLPSLVFDFVTIANWKFIVFAGFTVLIPDYYRGTAAKKHTLNRRLGLFIKRNSHWGKLGWTLWKIVTKCARVRRQNFLFSSDNFLNVSRKMPQKKDWEDVVLPYAMDHGCTTFGAIGTCWGSYMVVRMSSHPLISAGVSMYPSHSPIMKVMKEKEKDILAQIQVISISCVWYLSSNPPIIL